MPRPNIAVFDRKPNQVDQSVTGTSRTNTDDHSQVTPTATIASGGTASTASREARVARLRAELEADLAAHGLKAEVQGRPKHLYSILKKMRHKSKRLSLSIFK